MPNYFSLANAGDRPTQTVPLFKGGTFDAHFNSDEERRPIHFGTPKGMQRAVLEAVITGGDL
jgi:hypothetical protein